jgi:excisionase family DNA binding protein
MGNPNTSATRRSHLKSGAAAMPERKDAPRIIANGAAAVALAVKPKVAGDMLDVGMTRLYELIDAGELTSYKDGRSRKITTDSIRAYVSRKVGASTGTAAGGA